MTEERLCLEHGPYDASFGSCPVCAQEGSSGAVAPGSMGPAAFYGESYSDEDETVLPGQAAGPSPGYGDEEETVLPMREGGYAADDEETELPLRGRQYRPLDPDYDEELDRTVIPEREETGLMGWLIVKKSRVMRRGHIMKVKPGAIYGRNPKRVDVLIDDEEISGLHARIQIEDDQFVLIDLGSSNGTWVNDEKIKEVTPLNQDDEIRMGETTFVIKILE